jgi:DNA-binding response OmpR family regulator
MRILLVEDSSKLARALRQAFSEEGYSVDHAADGRAALALGEEHEYDVVVLDWMLPELDGLVVCRALRARDPSPAILRLTARGEVSDRVAGLDAGADDYLTKPFELRELLARIRALVRRRGEPTSVLLVRAGPLVVHRAERWVAVGESRVDLTSREHAVLLCLIRARGEVVSRRELLEKVWRLQFDPGTNVVDVQVRRLREKLGPHGRLIETARGVGYRLALPS